MKQEKEVNKPLIQQTTEVNVSDYTLGKLTEPMVLLVGVVLLFVGLFAWFTNRMLKSHDKALDQLKAKK